MAFQRKDLTLTTDRSSGERIPIQAAAMLVRSLPGGVTLEVSVNDEATRVPLVEGDMLRAKMTAVTFYHSLGSGTAVLIFTGGDQELGVTQRAPEPDPLVDTRMVMSGSAVDAGNTSAPLQLAKGGAQHTGAATWTIGAGANLTAGGWYPYGGKWARRLRATSAVNMQFDRYTGPHAPILFTRPAAASLYRPARDAECLRFIWEAAFLNIGPSGSFDAGTGFGIEFTRAMSTSATGIMGGGMPGARFYSYTGGLKANVVTEYQTQPIFRPPIWYDVTGISLADYNKFEIMIIGATGRARASLSMLVNDVTVAFAEWDTHYVSPIIGAPAFYPFLPTMPGGASIPASPAAMPQISVTNAALFVGDANVTVYISEFRHIQGPIPARR